MAPRPAPAELMDELVEEILFRVPPDDPASLLRAALVCRRWCRIVSAAGFGRRFREFHRTPPLLGFFHSDGQSCSFVSTSSFRRPLSAIHNSQCLIDARHGRVLLRHYDTNTLRSAFVVWDPITDESWELPLLPSSQGATNWNAAVLCASIGGACDHLDCQRGPFLVVFVGFGRAGMFAHVYSSEAAAWSEQISAPHIHEDNISMLPTSALVGNALYFMCCGTVLKYHLAAREMSLVQLPQQCYTGLLRTTEDGGLGFACIRSKSYGLYLDLWSMEDDVGWAKSKVIKLRKLLRDIPLRTLRLTGIAHGLDVILVASSKVTFTIDLKSVRATKVHGESSYYTCFPYMSFYTPGTRHWEQLPLPE